MQARVLRTFKDLEAGVRRTEGTVFECAQERFDAIMAKNSSLVEAVEAAAPKKAAAKKAPAKKAPAKKAEAETAE